MIQRKFIFQISLIILLLFVALPFSIIFYKNHGTAKSNNIKVVKPISVMAVDKSIPKDVGAYIDARLSEYYGQDGGEITSRVVTIKDLKIYDKDTGYYFYISKQNPIGSDRIDVNITGFNDVVMYVNGYILNPQSIIKREAN